MLGIYPHYLPTPNIVGKMAYVPKMARVQSFTSVASATSIISSTTQKACEGMALAPIRMMDLAKAAQAGSTTPSATAQKSSYVPPSMRIRAPAPPSRQLSFEDLSSPDLFPTLASPTPIGTPISGGWSMAQIRSRLIPATPTPKAPSSSSLASLSHVNSFAALDEEATEPSSTPRSTTSNFKLVLEERIKREEAARMGALIEDEPTDPKLMTPEQLAKNGWAVMKFPPKDAIERRAWLSSYNARMAAREAAITFDEFYGIPKYGAVLPLTLDTATPHVPDYPEDDMSIIDDAEEEYA